MKESGVTKFLVAVLLIGVCTLYASQAGAGTISDDFNGSYINPRLWSPFTESSKTHLSQQGGELRIRIDGGSVDHGAGVNGKFLVKGNFDASVDYRLITWPPTNGVRLGFEGGPNEKGFMVKRVSFGLDEPPVQKEAYFAFFTEASEQWLGNMMPTKDMQGSLRLVRVGQVLAGYFKKNGVWQLIASHDFSPSGFIEWVDICLWAIGDPPAGQNVEIAFDNFQLTYDQLRWMTNQTPIIFLLLD